MTDAEKRSSFRALARLSWLTVAWASILWCAFQGVAWYWLDASPLEGFEVRVAWSRADARGPADHVIRGERRLDARGKRFEADQPRNAR